MNSKIAYNICNAEYSFFLNKRNVQGIGIGFKRKKGYITNNKCIIVFVSKKIPLNNLNDHEVIPKYYKGVQTDVLESGMFYTQKIPPTLGGYSIGIATTLDTGSLGCLVTDNYFKYILSCNHVIADENAAPLGIDIIQPSLAEGGSAPRDTIGNLSEYVPIKFIDFTTKPENLVDCAVAKVTNNSVVSSKIALVGKLKGVVNTTVGETVKKVGRTTELTNGKVIAVNGTFRLKFRDDDAVFKNQIVTTKMSEVGDSGSILLNNYNFAVGLLMCGSESTTVFNSMTNVLQSLNMLLVV